jgi:predicted O-methyltransferase YrrM
MFANFEKEIHHELILKILQLTGCETYLELGVCKGPTFILANNIVKRAIGVDVYDDRIYKVGEFYECSTDDFFNFFHDNVDIVFIDADHHFESVRKDFENSLKILNKHGIIIFHDTDPVSEELLSPSRCGDGYKIVDYIYENHKELDMITLPVTIAGLTIVTRKSDRRVFNYINK